MRLERTSSKRNFDNVPWEVAQTPKTETQYPEVKLRRVFSDALVEEFELQEPIRYRDDSSSEVPRYITVPHPGVDNDFTTDLTSVPGLLTWMVPKSGKHLPAALIHDGLIGARRGHYRVDPNPNPNPETDPTPIHRIDADAVFRNAMHDLDVGLVRRWLVWAAVANASLVIGARPDWERKRWWFRIVGGLVLAVIAWCGVSATLEVFNAPTPPLGDLPWIDSEHWWLRILQGLAGAIVIPMALAALWGRYYRAGAIAGVALATVFHATVAVAMVVVFYQVIEVVARRATVALLLATGIAGGALALFVITMLT